MSDELADVDWLVSPDAARYLNSFAARRPNLLADARRLRRELSARRASLILEQAELRHRARRKFALAEQMFFTRLALEQATGDRVAAYKARRFAGRTTLVDFCAGIGGDLLALAKLAPTMGIERDAQLAALAEANLRLHASLREIPPGSAVAARELSVGDAATCSAWHIDPDRRPTGRRTTRPDLHEPGSPVIDALRSVQPSGAVKLAPAADVPPRWLPESEQEWLSAGRECKQLVVWFGELAQAPGCRRATAVERGAATFVGPLVAPVPAGRIGNYLYEFDPAVLAAGLAGGLMAELGLASVSPDGGYATADVLHAHGLVTAFRVDEVLLYKPKLVGQALADRRMGRLEIKNRGVHTDVSALVRQWKNAGDDEATVLLTRFGGRGWAVVAHRIR